MSLGLMSHRPVSPVKKEQCGRLLGAKTCRQADNRLETHGHSKKRAQSSGPALDTQSDVGCPSTPPSRLPPFVDFQVKSFFPPSFCCCDYNLQLSASLPPHVSLPFAPKPQRTSVTRVDLFSLYLVCAFSFYIPLSQKRLGDGLIYLPRPKAPETWIWRGECLLACLLTSERWRRRICHSASFCEHTFFVGLCRVIQLWHFCYSLL